MGWVVKRTNTKDKRKSQENRRQSTSARIYSDQNSAKSVDFRAASLQIQETKIYNIL